MILVVLTGCGYSGLVCRTCPT